MKTVQDQINALRNPRYKGKKDQTPQDGPLRLHKPAIYNAKTVSNPVISKTDADQLKGVEISKPWVPEYGKKK